MYVQAPLMHHHHQQPFYHPGQLPPRVSPPQSAAAAAADSPLSSSGASSQHPSPNRTPPLSGPSGPAGFYHLPGVTQFQQQQQQQQQHQDSGYASQLASLTNSPASSISSEYQQQQQQKQQLPGEQLAAAGLVVQPPVQPLMLPFGLPPIPFSAAAAGMGAPPPLPLPLPLSLPLPHFPQLLLPPPPPPQQQQQQQQQPQHQYLVPPPPMPPPPQAFAAATAFLQQQQTAQQQQQQLAGCPVFERDLPDSCRLHAAPVFRAYNFGSHVPPFDLVKWYSEKPPFILDGRTACLYKMREIDRKLPANMVLSADAEYNTVLAEYYILRNMFGPDYSLQDSIFIKLNRSKEGELAKFIHIFFRERTDAEVYMANAHKFGALTPAWSNPRAFSKHNVYITSVPYYLLSKESLCGYVRDCVLARTSHAAAGQPDPIKRARVDAEKRSAQVEFHNSEDAEALIAYFYRHIPEANARPAFDNAKEQRTGDASPVSNKN